MHSYGLIGFPLEHSFSPDYFNKKFKSLGLSDYQYKLFPLVNISEIRTLAVNEQNLKGLNITIPYKKSVIQYLDSYEQEVGFTSSCNTIKICRKNGIQLHGYNTDIAGFEAALKPLLKEQHKRALILGNGGSAATVKHVLNSLNIGFLCISRNPANKECITYDALSHSMISNNKLIINTTPLGMFPDTSSFPEIAYECLGPEHLCFDLVYNPEITMFMKKSSAMGATVSNGLQMLYTQAEASWKIWRK